VSDQEHEVDRGVCRPKLCLLWRQFLMGVTLKRYCFVRYWGQTVMSVCTQELGSPRRARREDRPRLLQFRMRWSCSRFLSQCRNSAQGLRQTEI